MADIVISDLPIKTALLESDLLVVDDGAQSFRVTGKQLREFLKVNYLPIGTVVWSQSNSQEDNPGRLPLWTGDYIPEVNLIYPDFYKWLQSHAELCRTKMQYDADLTEYGECPYYVLDEAPGSVRLPILKNYVKNAESSEGITRKKAGLPNIEGETGGTIGSDGKLFKQGSAQTNYAYNGGALVYKASFDASAVSDVYGNSDTVTPAHTTLFPWVYVYNEHIAKASADEAATAKRDAEVSAEQAEAFADEAKEYAMSILDNIATTPILSTKISDHLLSDIRWLRADTFSWQDGNVYTAAYNELLTEYNNAASADETDGSISFKRTPKGYKICTADQHDNVATAYDSSGVAWYYILDTTNTQFKLPRTKFGFTGLRTGAGNYVAPGVPNITGDFTEGGNAGDVANGAFGIKQAVYASNSGAAADGKWVDFNAARSSAVYGASDTVQPPATEMYLYFFAGNFTQSAVEQTAGLNAELFNGKADIDLANVAANIDYVVESDSDNDGNWWRRYKSGWIEQGGYTTNNTLITFLKPFSNDKYTFTVSPVGTFGSQYSAHGTGERTTTGIYVTYGGDSAVPPNISWYACGQGA